MSLLSPGGARRTNTAYRIGTETKRYLNGDDGNRQLAGRHVPSGIFPTYNEVFFSTLGRAGCTGAPAGGGGSEMGPLTGGFCGAEDVAGGGWMPLDMAPDAGGGAIPIPGGMLGLGG